MKRIGRMGRPSRQRGIFGFDIGGGSEDVTTTTDKESELERELTETEERKSTEEAQETEISEQVTTALPAEVQELLSELIIAGGTGEGGVGGASTGAEIAELGRFLTERATEAESAIAEDTQAIVENARRQGERDVTAAVTELSQQAGSSQGSFVQQIGLEASAQLESDLAALEAESSILGRSAATQEFQGALTALLGAPTAAGTETQSLVALTEALSGATTTQVGTTEKESSALTEDIASRTLEEIINELVSGTSTGEKEESSFGFGFEF